MKDTIIDRESERAANKMMVDDPQWGGVFADYFMKLTTGYFSQWYVDMVFQKWDRFPVDFFDAASFCRCHCLLAGGNIAIAKIDIGVTPCADSNIEEMNRRLQNLTHKLSLSDSRTDGPMLGMNANNVEAQFWGGTQGQDGSVSINKPIRFQTSDMESGEIVDYDIGGNFPLEVGYVSAAKTLYYLQSPIGRLARWPYGSTVVYLLCTNPEDIVGDSDAIEKTESEPAQLELSLG